MSKNIKQALTVDEVRSLADFFVDAYGRGYRPRIYVESSLDELVRKVRTAREDERSNLR